MHEVVRRSGRRGAPTARGMFCGLALALALARALRRRAHRRGRSRCSCSTARRTRRRPRASTAHRSDRHRARLHGRRRPPTRRVHGGQPLGLPRGRVPQHARATGSAPTRKPRSSRYVEGGGGFVGIGSAAEVEPGVAFFDGLIGARPAAASPTTPSDAVRRGRRPRASGDARPAARLDPLATSGTTGRRGRPAPSTPSPATARRRAGRRRHRRRRHRHPDLLVPRLPAAAAPSTPAWAASPPATPTPTSSSHLLGAHPVGHRPRARRLQGDDRRQLQGDPRASAAAPRPPGSPPPASRTA